MQQTKNSFGAPVWVFRGIPHPTPFRPATAPRRCVIVRSIRVGSTGLAHPGSENGKLAPAAPRRARFPPSIGPDRERRLTPGDLVELESLRQRSGAQRRPATGLQRQETMPGAGSNPTLCRMWHHGSTQRPRRPIEASRCEAIRNRFWLAVGHATDAQRRRAVPEYPGELSRVWRADLAGLAAQSAARPWQSGKRPLGRARFGGSISSACFGSQRNFARRNNCATARAARDQVWGARYQVFGANYQDCGRLLTHL